MSSTIIGFFDERSQAEQARSQLLDLGLKENDIRLFSSDTSETSDQLPSSLNEKSFGEKIKDFFTHLGEDEHSEELNYYAEGIRRGGTTVSVIADDAQIDRVSEILNAAGAVDIDRRAQYFKESGYTNYDLNAFPLSDEERLDHQRSYSDWETNRFSGSDRDQDEKVIPVIEENVNVGKRAVQKGRVRIFTRMSETPIDQEVNLKDERVDIERRAVDRPVQASDMAAFKEGEIELQETSEEAVVDKEARVVEEIRVRKQTDEHTERIHETARRTNVDVDRSNSDRFEDNDRLNR